MPSVSTSITCAPCAFSQSIIFLKMIAPDLGHARGRLEIGEMSLRETEVSVEAVDQDFERVLQRVEILLCAAIVLARACRLRLEPESAEIGQQVTKDLELIGHRETIELQHDRRIERGDVAMPDVARDAGEKDVRVAAFKASRHRHLGNGMALPEIFAQKERVNPGGVAAHDHILVVVRENLRLDEVARAQEIGDRACLAHGA